MEGIDPKVLAYIPQKIGGVPIPFFGGMPITVTLVTGLLCSVILIIIAVVIRLTVLKRLKQQPKGFQNVLELIIEGMSRYTNAKVGERTGNALAPYMFTLAAFIGLGGVIELVGFGKLRPAPSDINETVAFALITFILIRVFAYMRGGVIGRIKHYTHPMAIVAPVKLVTDMAVPVSLSCRMFGNLLGGYVVMELLYSSDITRWLLPVVGAAFFSLFHYGMQAFIFITLSLVFVEEAIE